LRDLKWILKLLLFTALALVIISVIFPQAFADNVTINQSYAVVDQPIYPYHEPYRIEQGDDVYVNDTIDISGQGWGSGIAWYGKYQEYDLPQYIYQFTPYKHDVQNFYLDPAIFAGKSGVWYQYYGNNTERNGNLEAFRVVNAYRNSTWTFPNGTTVELSQGISNDTIEAPLPKQSVLPEVWVSDYVVAHGDPLPTNFSKLWVFGRVDSIYNSNGNLTTAQILSLEDGSYKMVSHEAGINTIFEVGYDAATKTFTSPWKNVQDVSIYGSQPMLDIDRFYSMIRGTDDKIQTYNLDIEEPGVSVVSIDEVDVGSRIPIAWEPGMTLLDVRGYSNVQNDTTITVVMDPDIQTVRTLKANTWPTKAIRTSPGNKSMYQVYIPINKNQMPNGMHTILVTTAIGGSMRYDFPISELPADSYVPNATLKYIGDENPWKPNLTVLPPIIVVQTQVIEKTIIKEVPPSNETVYEQQKKALDDKIMESLITVVEVIVGLLIAFVAIRFAYRTWKRKGWE
jgi:hypothetical protein